MEQENLRNNGGYKVGFGITKKALALKRGLLADSFNHLAHVQNRVKS
jgi:hypothetical protein